VIERTPQRAYLDLRKLARDQCRNTQQLFELYIHERFLARVAELRFADKLVLKGGMLLAVLDVRRGTRDADMLARGLAGDESRLKGVVGEIASIPMADGVDFDTTAISIATIRDGAEYDGIRLALPASLGAELKLRLDLSFGDPVEPQQIDYPTLLGDQGFPLLGYLLESMIAEKADTMMFLGDASNAATRCARLDRLSEPSARAASSLGRRSAPAPACRACRSASPMSSMQSSTSSTGCRTRAARPGILQLDSGSRRRPIAP
jgi:hypothetical protein